jgi:hypothetical protein
MATSGAAKKQVPNWESARDEWVKQLSVLVDQIEAWAHEMDWVTRRIDKRMDDEPEVGPYAAPALLLQKPFARLLLEPRGLHDLSPSGAVDLCLMPAYDDVANLYFHHGKWRFHHYYPDAAPPPDASVAKAKPLTKKAVQTILAEMERHAGQIR